MEDWHAAEAVGELHVLARSVMDGAFDTGVHSIALVPAAPPIKAGVDAEMFLDAIFPHVD